MKSRESETRTDPSIRDLYPELSEEQLREAEENLHGYLEVVWRICQQQKSEQSDIFDTSRGTPYH